MELRHHCPNVPVVLLGLKSDLNSVVTEDEVSRATRETGAVRFLSVSSLTGANIDLVIPTVVRSVLNRPQRSLCKNGRFSWLWGRPKSIQQGPVAPQPPVLPLPEHAPYINISSSTFGQDLGRLLKDQTYADVELEVDGHVYFAHRIILCAASKYFRVAFDIDAEGQLCQTQRLLGASQHNFSLKCPKLHVTCQDLRTKPDLLPGLISIVWNKNKDEERFFSFNPVSEKLHSLPLQHTAKFFNT